MKAILGAIAISLAVPAFAQTAPETGASAGADQAQLQPAKCLHSAEDADKHCHDMMMHHGKVGRREKTKAEQLTAEVNGNGHQGHNH